MNHDACYCLDYDWSVCPKSCYRAKLTKEVYDSNCPWPVSFAHLKETEYCEIERSNNANKVFEKRGFL